MNLNLSKSLHFREKARSLRFCFFHPAPPCLIIRLSTFSLECSLCVVCCSGNDIRGEIEVCQRYYLDAQANSTGGDFPRNCMGMG